MQHANRICAFGKLGQNPLSFSRYHQEYSFHYFQFWWSGGGDTVLRWKGIQKLLGSTVLFLLLNVCLLLGCWQSFCSHSKPFMLISHMDTLKNSWVKRFGKKKKKRFVSQCSWGFVVNLWLSVGQTLNSSNSLSSGGKERPVVLWIVHPSSRKGRELLLRHCFAGQKLECCWALAEKPFLNGSQPEKVISQVLQRSSNRPLCHVCRTNEYPAERWGFNFSCCLLFPGRILGSPVSMVSQLQGEGTSTVHVYLCLKRVVCLCRHKPLPIISIEIIFPSVIMTSHFENPRVLPVEGRRKQACLSDRVTITSHQCLRDFASDFCPVPCPHQTRWEVAGYQVHVLSLISRSGYFFSTVSEFMTCFLMTPIPPVSSLPYCHLLHVVQGFQLVSSFQSWQEGGEKVTFEWNFRGSFFAGWGKREDAISFRGLWTESAWDLNLHW